MERGEVRIHGVRIVEGIRRKLQMERGERPVGAVFIEQLFVEIQSYAIPFPRALHWGCAIVGWGKRSVRIAEEHVRSKTKISRNAEAS